MRPKLVKVADKAPGQCLVSQDIEGPFIDAGVWAHWRDPYVYLSARWVEEVARDVLDMMPCSEHEEIIKELQEATSRYTDETVKLREYVDAMKKVERLTERESDGAIKALEADKRILKSEVQA